MRSLVLIGSFAGFIATAPVSAQSVKFRTDAIDSARARAARSVGIDGRDDRRGNDRIPPGQLPPAGMCRIWIDGVPPGRQPAPTDCQTAIATRPANARIIYGDQTAFPGKGKGKFDKHDRDYDDDIWRGDRDRRDINSALGNANGADKKAKGNKGKGKGRGKS